MQPLLVGRARESEDYTRDKTDDKDAVLIARLVGDLRCYVPERAEENWARLRHLGARRERLVAEATANVQQLRDLLECAWSAVLGCAGKPFESNSWCPALTVVLERCNGRPERLARMGLARFLQAVNREVARWGGRQVWRRIVSAVFIALTDRAGVIAQRAGALERACVVLADWHATKRRLSQWRLAWSRSSTKSTHRPGQLHPRAVDRRRGRDPGRNRGSARFDSPRAVVKHAGLCPRENNSGTTEGQARIARRGHPGLPHGGRSGAPQRTTRYLPLAFIISPPGRKIRSPPARCTPRSLPRYCAGCMSSSPNESLERTHRLRTHRSFRRRLTQAAPDSRDGPSSTWRGGPTSTDTLSRPIISSPNSIARCRANNPIASYVEPRSR
ncbi:transposase [Amycolatopsis bartoniae]|uniref:IS110 family transposase n=1 Tax=Amycolatopsis bartoniae TaxID=941986 RepID=A0A8H9J1G9_9PSEU|nr:transposase [Amycolatopsis bartoniae]GHF60209.1 hypothetical protein GCM10017566_37310 [Amycolatopsis bartoniae]